MKSLRIGILGVLLAIFSIGGSISGFSVTPAQAGARQVDFSGIWETRTAEMNFYPDHDFNDPLTASGCQIRVALRQEARAIHLQELFSECRCPAFIFKKAVPRLSFAIDEKGWLFLDGVLSGRISANFLEIDLQEGEYGVHYLRFERTQGGVEASWIYEDPIDPAFSITSGARPMVPAGWRRSPRGR